MIQCKTCGKEIDGKYGSGKYCSRQCANSRKWTVEDKIKKSKASKTSNKAKLATYNRTFPIQNFICICEFCKQQFNHLGKRTVRFCSTKCRDNSRALNISISNKNNPNCGGYKPNSSYGKSGWYKGYWCDSSYELAFVIYCLEHNIKFERNTQKFDYVFDGKLKKYIPDFILEDGTYIEIKGYCSDIVLEKIKYFPHKIKLLYKPDLKKEFDYVINEYGKHFIELYENNPYNRKLNVCLLCGQPAHNKYCSKKCSMKANKYIPVGKLVKPQDLQS